MKFHLRLLIVTVALWHAPSIAFADHGNVQSAVDVAVQTHDDCHMAQNLTVGSSGAEVSCLQEGLMRSGHLELAEPTGYFGELTKMAVQKWQEKNGIYSSGFFGPLSLAKWNGSESSHIGEDAMAPMAPEVHMHTARFDVATGTAHPSIAIEVLKDPKAGWNLHIKTANFKFTPEKASQVSVSGEGHGHIYVDGAKVTRAYSDWYFLGELPKGSHVVMVTLNTNDHADYYANNQLIAASTTILVQ